MSGEWATEAALVADFVAWVSGPEKAWMAPSEPWTCYSETAGWDLLLVRADGFQIGVEAKLRLNATVLCQVLAHDRHGGETGPDCHAILVPQAKAVNGLGPIAHRLGIVVIAARTPSSFSPALPRRDDLLSGWVEQTWPERCPDKRCALPEYVPDVCGGKPSPIALTPWKIAALKAQIILEVRGRITRADFKALRLSSSRWTQFWLRSDGTGGWVPSKMPDFRAQHPLNYEQIKADFAKWAPPVPDLVVAS